MCARGCVCVCVCVRVRKSSGHISAAHSQLHANARTHTRYTSTHTHTHTHTHTRSTRTHAHAHAHTITHRHRHTRTHLPRHPHIYGHARTCTNVLSRSLPHNLRHTCVEGGAHVCRARLLDGLALLGVSRRHLGLRCLCASARIKLPEREAVLYPMMGGKMELMRRLPSRVSGDGRNCRSISPRHDGREPPAVASARVVIRCPPLLKMN